jgi:hypothetical protein
LPVFLALSLGVHAAAFRALERHAEAPKVTFEPPSAAQTIAGETLEVESAPEAPGDDTETSAGVATEPAAPAGPRRAATRGGHANAAPAASAGQATVFGAVGVRYATDLATTFTRAFPQAASADPAWATAPFGPCGSADVTLVLDDDGRVTSSAVAGRPSAALRQGIARTLALIAPRTFTAREPVTTIRVSARVTRDDVHDGLHGDVFALSGGSFSGDLGSAFFALPPSSGPGRRVDVELRLLR